MPGKIAAKLLFTKTKNVVIFFGSGVVPFIRN